MLAKARLKFAKPFEKRVFVGGNYDFMPVLREICKNVRHARFEPILAFDFGVPKDMIYRFDIAVLQECKYAIFEVSSGNGHMMELQEAIHSKKNLFCLYGVRGRRHSRPPPAVSSMLTSSDIVLLGYSDIENLKDIILTIFPAIRDDLPSMLLRLLKIARVPNETKSRIVLTLGGQQFSMNGIPIMVAPTIESIAWSLCENLHKKHPKAISARISQNMLEILVRQRNAHYAEDNSDETLKNDLRTILSAIESLRGVPSNPEVSDLLCILSIALSRLVPPNQAVEFLKEYGPQTHPLLSFEYHLCLGNCYYRTDIFENALREAAKALNIKHLGSEETSRAELLIVSIYLAMSRKEKYSYCSSTLKRVLEKSKDPETIAQAKFLNGCILAEKSNYDAASRVFTTLLGETEPLRKPSELAIRFNRGISSMILGRPQKALADFRRCLQISKNDNQSRGSALGNIGLVYKEKGDLGNALKYLTDALKIHREFGYRQGEASDLGNIGLVYSAKGDLGNALKYLTEALNVLDRCGLVYGRDTVQRAINSITHKPN